MKICPVCNQTYTDESLNYCLNDGATLNNANDDPPPTIFMDPPRTTNPNYTDFNTDFSQPKTDFNSNFGQPNQEIYSAPYSPPAVNYSQDQTLPIVSLVLGVLGLVTICCHGGLPLGIAAAITGYLGMRNADQNPQKYGGKGMAVGGLILGAVGLLGGVVFIILAVIGTIAK